MKKLIDFIKKHSLPVSLIFLGMIVLYWIRDYRQVPSGLSSAFFPRLVAILMIVLSVLTILIHFKKENEGEFTPSKSANFKILLTTVLFLSTINLIKHVHVVVGIVFFLVTYLKIIAKITWKKTMLITFIGTIILYGMIFLLRISL